MSCPLRACCKKGKTMANIAIIDYGAGNLQSVSNALQFIGAKCNITSSTDEIRRADALILPGVGAFPDAMNALNNSNLISIICEEATSKPFLGICLGMQVLFSKGYEGTETAGLNLLSGRVEKINTDLKLPQIGWNSLNIIKPCPLTKGLSGGEYVYFVHSYRAVVDNRDDLCAVCDYNAEITAITAKDNLFGCQFHPEKSGDVGLHILKNFVSLV